MNMDELSPFEQAGKMHVDAWDQLNDLAKEEYRAFWNAALEAAAKIAEFHYIPGHAVLAGPGFARAGANKIRAEKEP